MPACRHHSVDLQLEHESGVASLAWADGDQVRQLLLNLVLNAIEAAGAGGRVQIALESTAQAAILRVVDSGPGPDRAVLDRLFEPFVTGKPDGIGLGLTVAKRIAEAHGGTIRCTDAAPTCFEVVLPHRDDEEAASGSSEPLDARNEDSADTHLRVETIS
jgi:signal transduction histidine kinase